MTSDDILAGLLAAISAGTAAVIGTLVAPPVRDVLFFRRAS